LLGAGLVSLYFYNDVVQSNLRDQEQWKGQSIAAYQDPEIREMLLERTESRIFSPENVQYLEKAGLSKTQAQITADILKIVYEEAAEEGLDDPRTQKAWVRVNMDLQETLVEIIDNDHRFIKAESESLRIDLEPVILEVLADAPGADRVSDYIDELPADTLTVSPASTRDLSQAAITISNVNRYSGLYTPVAIIALVIALFLSRSPSALLFGSGAGFLTASVLLTSHNTLIADSIQDSSPLQAALLNIFLSPTLADLADLQSYLVMAGIVILIFAIGRGKSAAPKA
jgi:hypothetical protein